MTCVTNLLLLLHEAILDISYIYKYNSETFLFIALVLSSLIDTFRLFIYMRNRGGHSFQSWGLPLRKFHLNRIRAYEKFQLCLFDKLYDDVLFFILRCHHLSKLHNH